MILAAAFISIPPAVAVIPIESAAVPAVFVNVIFSPLGVADGANIISVAPFLPSFNVFSSAKLGAISILPAVASIETASEPVPSDDMINDESPPPVTDNVKSLALAAPVVTVKLEASCESILNTPVVSIVIPPVPAFISIPPAFAESSIAPAFVPFVFTIRTSSLPSVPEAATRK